ncbi:MAG: hypothetical protein JOZ72_16490 [Alphaproteobacteria bacterium]|nr:hypothetical protein [Alphaproteobacteria bacterium]
MHAHGDNGIHIHSPGTIPEIIAMKIKISLVSFSNWWLIPIGGPVLSKHSMDRLTDKVNEIVVKKGGPKTADRPKNASNRKYGQAREKFTVDHLASRAVSKLAKSWPKTNEPQKLG